MRVEITEYCFTELCLWMPNLMLHLSNLRLLAITILVDIFINSSLHVCWFKIVHEFYFDWEHLLFLEQCLGATAFETELSKLIMFVYFPKMVLLSFCHFNFLPATLKVWKSLWILNKFLIILTGFLLDSRSPWNHELLFLEIFIRSTISFYCIIFYNLHSKSYLPYQFSYLVTLLSVLCCAF